MSALHHTGEEEVNEGNVTLSPVPPNALELWAVVVAEQAGKHLGCPTEVLLIPLAVRHKQVRLTSLGDKLLRQRQLFLRQNDNYGHAE